MNSKLSGRFGFVRASVSSGFRAPTPGQQNGFNISTIFDPALGDLVNNGTIPSISPVAALRGGEPLAPEKSINYTAGVVFTARGEGGEASLAPVRGCPGQRCRIRARMLTVVHGIDFSGDAQKWTPGCGRSNVWIATAQVHDKESMKLVALRPVQDLPGGSHPFERLVGLLAGGEYSAAGIDAPFALPARHMPDGGLPMLLQDVAELPTGSRPFTKGAELVAYGEENASLEEPKPLRKTEQFWRGRVNVRSTLWNGPRGGAPFTAGGLTLLGRARRPVWPAME